MKGWKEKSKRGNKFKSVYIDIDNIKFASKLESQYYIMLKLWKKYNHIKFFLRQVPFDLPGGVKYFVDYQIFYPDGTIKFVDVKGIETEVFKIKKKMVEALYPITIEVVKKGDF